MKPTSVGPASSHHYSSLHHPSPGHSSLFILNIPAFLSKRYVGGAVEELFDLFDEFLKNKGYLARGGQIIDAMIVSAPKQHNSREDNETIKEDETPED